jgi:hypothetical protein
VVERLKNCNGSAENYNELGNKRIGPPTSSYSARLCERVRACALAGNQHKKSPSLAMDSVQYPTKNVAPAKWQRITRSGQLRAQ